MVCSFAASIRSAISLGGDADTIACRAGGIGDNKRGMEMPKELAYCVYNHVLIHRVRNIRMVFIML